MYSVHFLFLKQNNQIRSHSVLCSLSNTKKRNVWNNLIILLYWCDMYLHNTSKPNFSGVHNICTVYIFFALIVSLFLKQNKQTRSHYILCSLFNTKKRNVWSNLIILLYWWDMYLHNTSNKNLSGVHDICTVYICFALIVSLFLLFRTLIM